MPRRPKRAETVAEAPFDLRSAPGHLLRLCQQRAVELFVAEVGEDGPTPRQYAVLVTIAGSPGLSQTDLVRATGIDRSTLTEIIRRLVRRGLVTRRTAADQRANALVLTSAGQTMIETVTPLVERAQTRILEAIPPRERAAAIRLLERLADGATADQPAGKTIPWASGRSRE